MKKIIISLLFLVTTMSFASSRGAFALEVAEERSEEEIGANIDTVVNKALKTFNVTGAAICVVKNGKLIFAKGYGFRDLEGKRTVTTKTLFAIGSCSKAFATFVLGTLVDEGLIKWDDSVIKHLPEFRLIDDQVTREITIRDLVTHRVGLPRHDSLWYGSNLSPVELLERLQYVEFVSGLREEFHYSNLMYVVIGLLIERVTGQPWEEAVKQRIFAPLGIECSNFSVEDSKNSSDFSSPYLEKKGVVRAIPFRNISNIGPAGSINSNIIDMSKWLQLQLSDGIVMERKLIQKATLEEMHTLQFANADFPEGRGYRLGYGLGWFIRNYGGHYLVEHSGGIDGFIANVSLFPKEKIGVVILSNSGNRGMEFVSSVNRSIFDTLLGLDAC